MRYAFQVAYDGTRYLGFVRQPRKRTVEGELLVAFERCGLYRDLMEARYGVAARTDRGVSAIGQVVSLDLRGGPNLSALNAALPRDIAVLAVAKAEPDFDPRHHAKSKHYRYIYEAPPTFNLRPTRRAAKLLEGSHDFKHFCKHERGRSTVGELERASVRGQKILAFDFVARSFLWQQVRRMVSALLSVGMGRMKFDELKLMLEGRATRAVPPAPAEGLILVKVGYPSLKFRPKVPAKFINHLKVCGTPRSDEMVRLLG